MYRPRSIELEGIFASFSGDEYQHIPRYKEYFSTLFHLYAEIFLFSDFFFDIIARRNPTPHPARGDTGGHVIGDEIFFCTSNQFIMLLGDGMQNSFLG
jgi:hypothetical protein